VRRSRVRVPSAAWV